MTDQVLIVAVRQDLQLANLIRDRMVNEGFNAAVQDVSVYSGGLANNALFDAIAASRCTLVVWQSLNDSAEHALVDAAKYAAAERRLLQVGFDVMPEALPWAAPMDAPLFALTDRDGQLTDQFDALLDAIRERFRQDSSVGEGKGKAAGRFAKLKRFLRWGLFIILFFLLFIIALVLYRPLLIAWADRFQSYGGAAPLVLNDDPSHLAPQMVVVPGGEFQMGSEDGLDSEKPVHQVRIANFAIGRFEVTFAEYDVFAHETNRPWPDDEGWGRGTRPVINVSWDDATAYAAWLAEKTGKPYRLPTEAEWEYAARGAMPKRYWWGDELRQGGKVWANCYPCGSAWAGDRTAPVGRFAPNPFGLYDTAGNVWEWVEDCYHDDYRDAPADGRAWEDGETCASGRRVLRGGSWSNIPGGVRSAARDRYDPGNRYGDVGFRLARTL